MTMSKNRVEAFSDGVFAIILTLLVLELRVPAIADHASLSEYAAAMAPLVPKVVSFVVTFGTICTHWVSHHRFFRQFERITLGLVWLNNLLLLWLCFLPFPTALLGDHPTDQFPILLYGMNSLLVALTFGLLRYYATRAGLFPSKHARVLGFRRSLPAIGLYALSIILSFVNAYLALASLVVVPIVYVVPNLLPAEPE